MKAALKILLPDRPVAVPILLGPFRGARIMANPRHALRGVFGLYERELSPWIRRALPQVARVLDVGANAGMFSFGCLAAAKRAGRRLEVHAFEPEDAWALMKGSPAGVHVHQVYVGAVDDGKTLTLDAFAARVGYSSRSLIKIDVEGAELDVIAGARSWLNPTNRFLIEVHRHEYIAKLQETFARHSLSLSLIHQRPLRLLGADGRGAENWWLVSA